MIYENAIFIQKEMEAKLPTEIHLLKKSFAKELECCLAIIHLAEFNEDFGSSLTETDMVALKEILRDFKSESSEDFFASNNLLFSNQMLVHLRNMIPQLKESLVAFVNQMTQF